MEMHFCKLCRSVLTYVRATYCSGTCRSRAGWLRGVEEGQRWLALSEDELLTDV